MSRASRVHYLKFKPCFISSVDLQPPNKSAAGDWIHKTFRYLTPNHHNGTYIPKCFCGSGPMVVICLYDHPADDFWRYGW